MNTIYKLNTQMIPLFSGTYNSFWEVIEYNEEGDREVDVDYDFKDFLKSIVEVYQSNEDYILNELNIPFIKEIKFTGEFYNPREYNFSTDSLDFDLTVDKTKLIQAIQALIGNDDFEKFLKDHYSSCDGFISFTPDSGWAILNAIQYDTDEMDQALSAVINYLTNDKYDDIENYIYETWSGNGYGGLDYKIITNSEN